MANQPLPHTAIPTWSRFIYQGRATLYHILKQLNTENKIDYILHLLLSYEQNN